MLANSSLTVNAGTALTGGGAVSLGGSTTLNVDTTKVPLLNAANTFTGNQTVNGNLSATGVVTGSSYQIGSNLFAFGSYASQNAFLGFAGNTNANNTGHYNTATGYQVLYNNTTGNNNTAVGDDALYSNTTGIDNTATGAWALQSNTTGNYNAAIGAFLLSFNTTGSENTAAGVNALNSNTTASENTASGFSALLNSNSCCNVADGQGALYLVTSGPANTGVGNYAGATADSSNITGSNNTFLGTGTVMSTGTLTNATAIGANAEVGESNALVLGSINGVNGQTASVNVGIGTYQPAAPLDIATQQNFHTYIGAPCSGSTYGAIAFGTSGFQNCTNYSLQGDGTNTYINAPSDRILFRIANLSGPSIMQISASQVGIATNTPDATLSVNGSADKPGGGSWGTFSDRRLKTLDGSFSSGLSQVLKINPVRYRYKSDNAMGIRDTDEHVGLVAQDVQKVIPEAVTENSKGYLLVNNDPIIWTMLNAIKEQQALIRTQQEQIRAQQEQIRTQQAQLKAQQSQIKARQSQGQLQQAQIAELMSQFKTIQASLKTNDGTGAEVRTVKAQVQQ